VAIKQDNGLEKIISIGDIDYYAKLTDILNELDYTPTIVYDRGYYVTNSNYETTIGSNDPQGQIPYHIVKVTYGDLIGYRNTDLVYAGDLIANTGETVVTVLDKIKSMLGNYEYFFDTNGYFIFQKRKDFINNDFSAI